MLRHILPRIPKHRVYIEPYAGGAAVFFAKQPSPVEILADTNGSLCNLYACMQSDFDELHERIGNTLHCEFTYQKAMLIHKSKAGSHDQVSRALAFCRTSQTPNSLFTLYFIPAMPYYKKKIKVELSVEDQRRIYQMCAESMSRKPLLTEGLIPAMQVADTFFSATRVQKIRWGEAKPHWDISLAELISIRQLCKPYLDRGVRSDDFLIGRLSSSLHSNFIAGEASPLLSFRNQAI